jgi:hypothetical protein
VDRAPFVLLLLALGAGIALDIITRAEHGHELDAGYLGGLSDDAVPAVVDAIRRSGSNAVRTALREAFMCTSPAIGAAALNVATIHADTARRQLCS